jgi:hypothetical protein
VALCAGQLPGRARGAVRGTRALRQGPNRPRPAPLRAKAPGSLTRVPCRRRRQGTRVGRGKVATPGHLLFAVVAPCPTPPLPTVSPTVLPTVASTSARAPGGSPLAPARPPTPRTSPLAPPFPVLTGRVSPLPSVLTGRVSSPHAAHAPRARQEYGPAGDLVHVGRLEAAGKHVPRAASGGSEPAQAAGSNGPRYHPPPPPPFPTLAPTLAPTRVPTVHSLPPSSGESARDSGSAPGGANGAGAGGLAGEGGGESGGDPGAGDGECGDRSEGMGAEAESVLSL